MWRFTAGALLVLLPWFGGLASGEICVKFKGCRNFFYKETPPVGFTGVPICQRYKGNYHFATMYDRQHRTARYSAYLLTPADGNRPSNSWMYEPQLASNGGDREMKEFPPNSIPQDVIRSQAVLEDYTGGNYTKGHLAPSQHMGTSDDRAATFTLTNIVPQTNFSNNGPWSDLEKRVLQRFRQYCTGKMYVITGTIPYKPVRLLKGRVSIPEYIWSAYCCPSFKSKLPNDTSFFPTYAAVGRNDPDSGEEIVEKDPSPYAVKEMSLANLENILWQNLKKKKLNLFKGQCKQGKP
ncbi:endonuclease domain-containing 1 protein-like [Mugil cephalus]|uniref:endonuclease domain-containing 1 protein-like n=1 Tax=Mugil cephalus TaxID=48193 RepID=UPI001FB682B1|nr:endonuclease domain-containing 1 protein-like [Mugil cephalus]